MSKEYQKRGVQQHKGGGKQKAGPAPGAAPINDMYKKGK